MASVDIIFDSNGEKIVMSFWQNTSVKKSLNEYLRKTDSTTSLYDNQIAFFYRNIILNSNDNSNKSLKDLKIKSHSVVRVINKGGIEAAGGP